MKLELKENMYVRTILGISKLVEIKDDNVYVFDKLDDDLWTDDIADEIWEYELKDVVIKASYNIIDILEVGDYVNGEKVIALKKDIPERNIYFNSKKCNIFTDYSLAKDWYFGIEDEDIKSIVTKEQFEKLSFKVGD